MELEKEFQEKLLKKGVTENEINSKVEELREVGKKVMPDDIEKFLKIRLNAFYRGVLNKPDMKNYKAVILGFSDIEDSNEVARRVTEIAVKQNKKIPKQNKVGEFYEAKEGFFSYGFKQGEPIPDTPDYRREIVVYTEIEKIPYLRTLVLRGDSSNQELGTGKKIEYKISTKQDLKKDIFFINDINMLDEKVDDSKIIDIVIEKKLKDKIKTLSEAKDNKRELVIIKGTVGMLESRGNNFNIGIYDNSQAEEDGLVEFFLKNPKFSEYAISTYFIGNVFYNKNKQVWSMNINGVIVPEHDKKVEIDNKFVEEAADNAFSNELDVDEVDLS